MCGIVGLIGQKNVKQFLLNGLAELEYRGYDSTGIAIANKAGIHSFRSVGKLKNLIEKTKDFDDATCNMGIGHTRWATHGKPTTLNAHPHSSTNAHVVHNGIIENYQDLKQLITEPFVSQTDTEVIVHLFEKYYKELGNGFAAFEKTILDLRGSFAILMVSATDEQTIFFAKQGSPLEAARAGDEVYFASSDAPLVGHVTEAIYLEDGVYGYATPTDLKFFKDKKPLELKAKQISADYEAAQKEGFTFFMEKEIYEQKKVLIDVMTARVDERVNFEELDGGFLDGVRAISICACGTSYHAGLVGSYLFTRLARQRVSVEIASEFRYKDPVMNDGDLFIVISQSGETADTLEALKMAKNAGLKTLAICNVDNTSIVRLADRTILTRAGIEKGVASTKAFSAQVAVLWLLALQIGQETNKALDLPRELEALKEILEAVEITPELRAKIARLSKRYLYGHGFFFIGRDIFYPLALEGALKLKEISYLHAEGYPSGEMKHGPIALADTNLYTIALMPQNLLYDKIKSNVEELSARDSVICAVTPKDFFLADDTIKIKSYKHPMSEFYAMLVALQLLAMEISVRLGNDVDMPRNLAKSVTVE